MSKQNTTEAAEVQQGWHEGGHVDLDDWAGLYTVDDGRPGSYDHEGLAVNGTDSATLICQCGDWSGSVPRTVEDAEGLMARWRTHVYAATGRARPAQEPDPRLTVGYEIDHGRLITEDVRCALECQGLDVLGSDAMPWEAADATVTGHSGGVMVDRGDMCELVRPLETWTNVAEYAAVIARIVRGEDEPALVCPAPGCEVEVTAERPWCCDACRSMDLAAVGGAR